MCVAAGKSRILITQFHWDACFWFCTGSRVNVGSDQKNKSHSNTDSCRFSVGRSQHTGHDEPETVDWLRRRVRSTKSYNHAFFDSGQCRPTGYFRSTGRFTESQPTIVQAGEHVPLASLATNKSKTNCLYINSSYLMNKSLWILNKKIVLLIISVKNKENR